MSQLARRIDNDLDGYGQSISQAGMQRVQTEYTTAIAVQRKRNLTVVSDDALREAAMIGAEGYYAWGNGKDRVVGPSKDLAMMLVRCFGNCAVDMGEVQEVSDAWIMTAKFIDLETGFTLARQFRQSKEWKVYGKFDDARKEDIRFQIGQSKAVRNVILNAVPKWLVNRALDCCMGGVREKIEKSIEQHGSEKVIGKALARLDSLGVPETRVLATMGRKTRNALTIEDLVVLNGNIAALESKSDTIESMFPTVQDAEPNDGSPKSDRLAKKLSGESTFEPEQAVGAEPESAAETEEERGEPMSLAEGNLNEAGRAEWDRLLDVARTGVANTHGIEPEEVSDDVARPALIAFLGSEGVEIAELNQPTTRVKMKVAVKKYDGWK